MNVSQTRGAVKTRGVVPTKATKILFDGGRKTRVDSFGAGILPPTRWTGEYRKVDHTAGDEAFVAEVFGQQDFEALDEMYDAILEHRAFEAEACERLARGFVGM